MCIVCTRDETITHARYPTTKNACWHPRRLASTDTPIATEWIQGGTYIPRDIEYASRQAPRSTQKGTQTL